MSGCQPTCVVYSLYRKWFSSFHDRPDMRNAHTQQATIIEKIFPKWTFLNEFETAKSLQQNRGVCKDHHRRGDQYRNRCQYLWWRTAQHIHTTMLSARNNYHRHTQRRPAHWKHVCTHFVCQYCFTACCCRMHVICDSQFRIARRWQRRSLFVDLPNAEHKLHTIHYNVKGCLLTYR